MSSKFGRRFLAGMFVIGLGFFVFAPPQCQASDTEVFHRAGERNSLILGLDASGNVLGTREVGDENGWHNECYWRSKGKDSALPLLDGYTNTDALAISSQSGLVVGRAQRSARRGEGNLQAFVWNPQTNAMTGLGFLEGDRGSSATGISADGKTVCGVSLGDKGVRPCVWKRDGNDWKATELSTIVSDNPLLGGKGLVISPDGSKIAGCITFKVVVVGRIYISYLYQWEQGSDGKWTRKLLSETGVATAMNDKGAVTGYFGTETGEHAFLYTADGGFKDLGCLPDDKTSRATAINGSGVVVGYSGASGYERAFVWRDGKMETLSLLKDTILSAANAINDRGEVGGYLGGEEDSHIYPFLHKLAK